MILRRKPLPSASPERLPSPGPHAALSRAKIRLVKKRFLWWPTWQGWLLIAVTLVLLAGVAFSQLYPFLAVVHRIPANILVVEGWAEDSVLITAKEEFENGDYEYLVTEGGPLDSGSFLSSYETYAHLAAATLRAAGFSDTNLIEAPAGNVPRDRTYAAAQAVREKLAEEQIHVNGINVVTSGPHGRRTRAAFRHAFGPETPVGIISVPSQAYQPERWWTTSDGIKDVLAETLGWIHELLTRHLPQKPNGLPASSPESQVSL